MILHDAMEDSGSVVTVTLKSVQGTSWKSNDENCQHPPKVCAGISFHGSAPDMQVGTLSMCSRTGNLIVESNPMEFDRASRNREALSETGFPICFTFNDPLEHSPRSTCCAASPSQPHMKLRLPDPALGSPTMSLADANRDSKVVEDGVEKIPSLDSATLDDDDTTGLPEIVELRVRLQTEDYSVCEEAVAHLVLYRGQECTDSTTMDLRLKRQSASPTPFDSSPASPAGLVLQEDAAVRVQISISQPKQESYRQSLDPMEYKRALSKISEQIDQNERLASARANASKLNLNKPGADNHKDIPKVFCSSGSEMKSSMFAFLDVFRRCHQTSKRNKKKFEGPGFLRSSSTMQSTIETRDSLLI